MYRYTYSGPGRNTSDYTNRCIAFAEDIKARGFCIAGDVEVLCNLLIDAMDDIQQYVSDLEEMKEIVDGDAVIGTIEASRDLGARVDLPDDHRGSAPARDFACRAGALRGRGIHHPQQAEGDA